MKTVPLHSLCDQSVFEKVYKQYSKDLYRFLTYSFQDTNLSEEITQNVFLKLWDQCEKFDLRNIKSLIFTMGKNLSLNEIKRNQKTEGAPIKEIHFSESPQELLEGKQFKEKLTQSLNQLSDLLKKETGKGIKEHVHDYVILKAKSILLSSDQSISEIAYDLGFEYVQSFSRLFKSKTGLSPVEFRSLN